MQANTIIVAKGQGPVEASALGLGPKEEDMKASEALRIIVVRKLNLACFPAQYKAHTSILVVQQGIPAMRRLKTTFGVPDNTCSLDMSPIDGNRTARPALCRHHVLQQVLPRSFKIAGVSGAREDAKIAGRDMVLELLVRNRFFAAASRIRA